MSLKKVSTVVMLILVAAATLQYFIELHSTKSHLDHMQSSHSSWGKKHRDEMNVKFHGKASGLFQVKSNIESHEGRRVLQFEVKANQDVDSATVTWHLPEPLKILHGQPTFEVSGLHRGDVRTFEIEVASLDSTVAFAEIHTLINGIKFGATTPFTESVAKSLVRAKAKAFSTEKNPVLIQ